MNRCKPGASLILGVRGVASSLTFQAFRSTRHGVKSKGPRKVHLKLQGILHSGERGAGMMVKAFKTIESSGSAHLFMRCQ